MTHYFSTTLNATFDDAVTLTKEALKRHNFSMVSQINISDNLRHALNKEFRPYLIIGVCQPELTYRALEVENKIGTLLPCNVVVQELDRNKVEVSAVDPVSAMEGVDHVVVGDVARQIRAELSSVISEI